MPSVKQAGYHTLNASVQTCLENDISLQCKGYAAGVCLPGVFLFWPLHMLSSPKLPSPTLWIKRIRNLPSVVGKTSTSSMLQFKLQILEMLRQFRVTLMKNKICNPVKLVDQHVFSCFVHCTIHKAVIRLLTFCFSSSLSFGQHFYP